MNPKYFVGLYSCLYLAAVNNAWDKPFILDDIFTLYSGGMTPTDFSFFAGDYLSNYGAADELYIFEKFYDIGGGDVRIKLKNLSFRTIETIITYTRPENGDRGNINGQDKENFVWERFLNYFFKEKLGKNKDVVNVIMEKAKKNSGDEDDQGFWAKVYFYGMEYIDFVNDFFE